MQDVSSNNLINFITNNHEALFSREHSYGDSKVSNIFSAPELAPPKIKELAELFKDSPYGEKERIHTALIQLVVAINSLPFCLPEGVIPTLLVPENHRSIAEHVVRNCEFLASRMHVRSYQELTDDTWYLTSILAIDKEFTNILNSNPVQLYSWPNWQKIDPTFTNQYPWHYIVALEKVEDIMHK